MRMDEITRREFEEIERRLTEAGIPQAARARRASRRPAAGVGVMPGPFSRGRP
jgi:hypothetical protein